VGQLTAFLIGGKMIEGELSMGWAAFILFSCILGIVLQYIYFFKSNCVWRWVKLSMGSALLFVALVYTHLLFSHTHVIPVELIRMVVILLVYSIIAAGIVGLARLRYE
jgi:hypothetical protein